MSSPYARLGILNGMDPLAFLLLAGSCAQLPAQQSPAQRASLNQPIKPFRIVGNVYHVGVAGVTTFLIATPAGTILLDGGFPETVPRIEQNMAALGFRLQHVKLLLNSHAHYDHCGG